MRYYPFAIWLIGFCIVLRYALVDFAFVSDSNSEFIIYNLVIETGRWQSVVGRELLSSCLWTSYIPAMFQRLFNSDIAMTYKLFPCFIFPILPLTVYYLARKMVSPFYAFLASMFLMVQIYFLWMPQLARVGVSLVFFGLALLVIFNENLRFRKKVILFGVLAVCLATAHYGTAYVAIFVLGITCGVLVVLWGIRRIHHQHITCGVLAVLLGRKEMSYPYLKALLVFTGVLVVAVVLWHGLLNPAPLDSGKRMISLTVEGTTYEESSGAVESESSGAVESESGGVMEPPSYWSLVAREGVIQVAFGKTFLDMNVPQKVEFVSSWLTILLMSWGLALTAKRWGVRSEFGVLMGVCYLTIVISVIVPAIGIYYGIARVYFHMMVPLSVCFAIGSMDVAGRLRMPRWLLLVVALVIFGLCTSGLMYQVFGITRIVGSYTG